MFMLAIFIGSSELIILNHHQPQLISTILNIIAMLPAPIESPLATHARFCQDKRRDSRRAAEMFSLGLFQLNSGTVGPKKWDSSNKLGTPRSQQNCLVQLYHFWLSVQWFRVSKIRHSDDWHSWDSNLFGKPEMTLGLFGVSCDHDVLTRVCSSSISGQKGESWHKVKVYQMDMHKIVGSMIFIHGFHNKSLQSTVSV